MLIDDFLPKYDVHEQHQIMVHAPVEQVYAAARALDIRHANVTQILFRLRGLPSSSKFNLNDFIKMRFILLGEKTNQEFVLGLVGQFWTLSGKLLRVDAEGFRNFDEKGFAKAVWNFSLAPQADNTVLLETETRVLCLDDASRKNFRLYWTVIGPFSQLIRRDILQAIKKTVEDYSE